MEGIRIPRDVAREEGVPEDLDSGVLGPYRFPSPARRRTAANVYLAGALLSLLGALADLAAGLWIVSVGLIALAVVHNRSAWPLNVDLQEALLAAGAAAPFTVGHASAALGFVGLRAAPVWNVILYSAEDPPDRRSLVRLDAVTGDLLDHPYVEALVAGSQ